MPKKSNKVPILICAGCAVLALLLISVGAGIFLFTRDGGEPVGDGPETITTEPDEPETDDPETDEPTTDEPTTEEPTTDEPTTDEPTDEPSAGKGSQDAPYAVGQTFTIDDEAGGTLDITVGEIDWDATEAVMGRSAENPEPGDGEVYILVPVTVTYHGDSTQEPMLLLWVDYLSDAGGSYEDAIAVTPNTVFEKGTMRDGDTEDWEYGIIVPEDEVQAGSVSVRAFLDFSNNPTWVRVS
ncbi:hypothetical protein H3H54_15530 [Brachybacterium sp. Z12]|uniref:hypothetical protein n=1 Tax=Brachybacterium sp. Z12 TaxID=2759167 RepID=UPI00186160C4|nr:hypothetical protein [Brachybacterium sp. Z12]QNN82396.1 hypothetical protein H3H54_15530 [Brachybacterium sp. Z12]